MQELRRRGGNQPSRRQPWPSISCRNSSGAKKVIPCSTGSRTSITNKKSNEFTKAALDWLESKAKWPRKEIEQGKFMSNQSKAPAGKELKWDDKKKKWLKA